jgi:cytidyltransferase-like protein
MNEKRFLGTVFALGLTQGKAALRTVASRTGFELSESRRTAQGLQAKGLVELSGPYVSLTKKGRRSIRVVFIGGGFEIIHPGHIHTVERARKLGDVLVVVVARDSTIRKRKGREPVAGEEERVKLLSSLRQVDAAMLGVEGDIYLSLERVKPDVVALGYDQHHVESEILREGAKRGMRLEVVRLDTPHPLIKTSRLLQET